MLKYIKLQLNFSFSFHSLRIKYEPSEGAMMIDLSTIHSLELIQNLQNAKSTHCLFGVVNQTLTPMGARLLKSNLLQPLTELGELENRFDAVGELGHKEEVFFAVRQGTFYYSYILEIVCTFSYEHSSQGICRRGSSFDYGELFH